MGYIIKFLTKNLLFVFFLILQLISLTLIFSKNSMQRSFLAGEVVIVNSWISESIDEGASYLKLKNINNQLVHQNKFLMEQLYGKGVMNIPNIQTVNDSDKMYTMEDANVMNNSIIRKDNYFTINRGTNQGISSQMGVIGTSGIAGIVINSMENYSIVQSVLSVNKSKINAALKKSNYFGTLTWRGDDARIMHLSEIPKYVTLKIGDTVVTDGKSDIFPSGITIGTIAGYQIDKETGFWDISVELSQKMGNIQKVFVVKNLQKKQVEQVQDSLNAILKNDK